MSGPDPGAKAGASTTGEAPIGRPWYVQFWPLFLVFLMVASIGGSLATVALAYRHADVDVRASSAPSEWAKGAHGETVRGETGSPR